MDGLGARVRPRRVARRLGQSASVRLLALALARLPALLLLGLGLGQLPLEIIIIFRSRGPVVFQGLLQLLLALLAPLLQRGLLVLLASRAPLGRRGLRLPQLLLGGLLRGFGTWRDAVVVLVLGHLLELALPR